MRVAGAPASDADQQIRQVLVLQHRVETRHLLGDLMTAQAIEVVKVDEHHVAQVGNPAVTQHPGTTAQQLGRHDRPDLQLLDLAGQRQRPHLQKAELGQILRRAGQIHGELDLHRRAGAPRAEVQQDLE